MKFDNTYVYVRRERNIKKSSVICKCDRKRIVTNVGSLWIALIGMETAMSRLGVKIPQKNDLGAKQRSSILNWNNCENVTKQNIVSEPPKEIAFFIILELTVYIRDKLLTPSLQI